MNKNNPTILRTVAIGVIRAMREGEFLKEDLTHADFSFMESMFLRLLSFYITCEESELIGPDGKITPVRLKELEIEIETMMAKPDLYFVGNWKEAWDSQRFLRDETWLEETIREEEEEFSQRK